MRQATIALGACVAALALSGGGALAQNSAAPNDVQSTYQAAQQAGASAQKVAPPNLVLPADKGGGTWSEHYGTNATTTMPSTTSTAPSTTPSGTNNNGTMTTPGGNTTK
jgi:hypothetical protein